MGVSRFVVKYLNVLTLLMSIVILSAGIWLATKGGTQCERFLTVPVVFIGVSIFVISFLGCVGASKESTCLLWLYIIFLTLLLLLLTAFTIFTFVVTNESAGDTVSATGVREYRLGDYSTWLQKRVEDKDIWRRIKDCLSDLDVCGRLAKQHPQEITDVQLDALESGCCKPLDECGFVMVNTTYYTIKSPADTMDEDCGRYDNSPALRCYMCDSCKAGFLHTIKDRWRAVAFINLAVLAILTVALCCGCAARRSAKESRYGRLPK
ncbi:hypothetical protein CBR_g26240 [Chara braunii]|uniref:Tetraspanin n=1 Tax=Chara braunii TaxID=69332 RepID=A0A388L7E1_CHABU|nr:hypothetical protein CBR_g26240 [Chara braunii]|eukprot:GBG78207.1 hypothetical protein CBR_g26240 [Chara braunii]